MLLILFQLSGMGQLRGQNATYRNQLGTLRSENATLQRKASDLTRQLSDVHGSPVSLLTMLPALKNKFFSRGSSMNLSCNGWVARSLMFLNWKIILHTLRWDKSHSRKTPISQHIYLN